MQREKFCKYCQTYFFYEDEVDPHGVAISRDDNRSKEGKNIKKIGYCPKCIDPHRIAGLSFYKTTILSLFRDHLKEKGIDSIYLDDDTIVGMLVQFPRAYEIFNSNGTYRTFTILSGSVFDGKYGKFMIGEVKFKPSKKRYGVMKSYREIVCLRCKNIAIFSMRKSLGFYLTLMQKCCQSCDSKEIDKNKPKNISGLNRRGSVKSEFSERALAKALNVSRNDFRRHRITKPEPPLPIDTVVNGLRIEEAYWDEETMYPRYLLVCDNCNETFTCIQNRVFVQQHFCSMVK